MVRWCRLAVNEWLLCQWWKCRLNTRYATFAAAFFTVLSDYFSSNSASIYSRSDNKICGLVFSNIWLVNLWANLQPRQASVQFSVWSTFPTTVCYRCSRSTASHSCTVKHFDTSATDDTQFIFNHHEPFGTHTAAKPDSTGVVHVCLLSCSDDSNFIQDAAKKKKKKTKQNNHYLFSATECDAQHTKQIIFCYAIMFMWAN